MATQTKPLAATVMVALLVGCATSEGNEQALGAALGSVAGGAICAIVGGNAAECLASAAGGALVGWGMAKAKQVMERRTELPQDATKPAIMIRSYQIDPSAVAAGQTLTVNTTYDLLTPKSVGPRPVTQTFKIQASDGKEVTRFTPMQDNLKEQGRYEVSWEIPIPKKAPLGRYQLVQELDAETSSPEVRTATFEVVKEVAWME